MKTSNQHPLGEPTPDDLRRALASLQQPAPSAEWRQRTLHSALRQAPARQTFAARLLHDAREAWHELLRPGAIGPAGAGFACGLALWMAVNLAVPADSSPTPQQASAPASVVPQSAPATLAQAEVASLLSIELFGLP